MTTIIINKEKDAVKVYSDRLYQAINKTTGEIDPSRAIYDIKAIKINEDLIVASAGYMSLFMTLAECWRRQPEVLDCLTDIDHLIGEIYAVLKEYSKQPVKQFYDLYIINKDEVLYLDIGLNVNPKRPVSIISKTHKITSQPQIYGGGRKVFNKPKKLGKMLKKSPQKVFEKISANPDTGTSKEFDTLSINL